MKLKWSKSEVKLCLLMVVWLKIKTKEKEK